MSEVFEHLSGVNKYVLQAQLNAMKLFGYFHKMWDGKNNIKIITPNFGVGIIRKWDDTMYTWKFIIWEKSNFVTSFYKQTFNTTAYHKNIDTQRNAKDLSLDSYKTFNKFLDELNTYLASEIVENQSAQDVSDAFDKLITRPV